MIEVNEFFYFAFLAVCPQHFSSPKRPLMFFCLLYLVVYPIIVEMQMFFRAFICFFHQYNPVSNLQSHWLRSRVFFIQDGYRSYSWHLHKRASRIDIPFAKPISPPNLSFCRMKTGSALASVELLSNRNIQLTGNVLLTAKQPSSLKAIFYV